MGKNETPAEQVNGLQGRAEKIDAPDEAMVYAPQNQARAARAAAKTALKACGWVLLLAALAAAALWVALWALPQLGVETKGLLDGFAGQFEERYGDLLRNR